MKRTLHCSSSFSYKKWRKKIVELIIMKKLDLTGQVFNQLLVLKEDLEKTQEKHESYWICRCSCGNIKTIRGAAIKSGKTKSCGCLQKKKMQEKHRIDMTNIKYNHLLVLEPDTYKNGNLYWKCQCDCGNIVTIRGADIRNGHTKSCGCLKTFIEEEILSILKNNNFEVIAQKRFPELLGDNGGQLSYDFYLPKEQIVIECQGKQHYEPIEWYGGQKKFQEQQSHDFKKAQYALQNKLRLIIIPYWDYDKVNEDYLLNKITTI